MFTVFLGWDRREELAYKVAVNSLLHHTSDPVEVVPVVRQELIKRKLYRRPTEVRDDRLWDTVSDAPMSTEHAIARFFVPFLASPWGDWALWADGDVLFRADIARLFSLANSNYAVQVVKHLHQPTEATKMDGQIQTRYLRKNWSSVILWNLAHRSNHKLTTELLNTQPGRNLHAFCWLSDEEIGELPYDWNYLVGVDAPYNCASSTTALAHFTLGTPDMEGHETCVFADEWRSYLRSTEARTA